MLPIPQTIQSSSHYWLCELRYPFWTILEAVDEGWHGLEACYFTVDIVGFEVFVPEEGYDLVDLIEMALIGVLGNYYLDVTPR